MYSEPCLRPDHKVFRYETLPIKDARIDVSTSVRVLMNLFDRKISDLKLASRLETSMRCSLRERPALPAIMHHGASSCIKITGQCAFKLDSPNIATRAPDRIRWMVRGVINSLGFQGSSAERQVPLKSETPAVRRVWFVRSTCFRSHDLGTQVSASTASYFAGLAVARIAYENQKRRVYLTSVFSSSTFFL